MVAGPERCVLPSFLLIGYNKKNLPSKATKKKQAASNKQQAPPPQPKQQSAAEPSSGPHLRGELAQQRQEVVDAAVTGVSAVAAVAAVLLSVAP